MDVPETTDRVLASVTGQFRWMGTAAFVVDNFGSELCSIPDPAAPAANVTCNNLDSRITAPSRPHDACGRRSVGRGHRLVTSCARFPILRHLRLMSRVAAWTPESQIRAASRRVRPAVCGSWTIAGDELCSIPDPAAPAANVTCNNLDSRITAPSRPHDACGRRSVGRGHLAGSELCSIPDPAAPAANVTCNNLDSRITAPSRPHDACGRRSVGRDATSMVPSCARFPILRHLRLMSRATTLTPGSQPRDGLTEACGADGLSVMDRRCLPSCELDSRSCRNC